MIDFLAQRQVFFSDSLFRLIAFFKDASGKRRLKEGRSGLSRDGDGKS